MKISLLLSIVATGFSVAALSSTSTPALTTLRNARTTSSSSPSQVQVRKCCPVGERLDSSDPTSPRCVQRSSSSQEMNVVGLDLTKDPGSRKVNLTLALDSQHPGMPKCKPEGAKVFSVLTEKAWLTAKGNLVQDSQEHEMRHYEFCVDLMDDGDDDDDGDNDNGTAGRFGAVSCDACTKDHPCVNLCCPHGTALVKNPLYNKTNPSNASLEICGTETLNKAFSPEFWTKHDMQMEEYGKQHGFILKAPSSSNRAQFVCPKPLINDDPLHLYSDYTHSSYTITPDGRLQGYNIDYQHQQKFHKNGTFSWDNDKFCVSYADVEYDYDYDEESGEFSFDYVPDGVFQLTFSTCYDSSCPGPSQAHIDFLESFNPISLCITIFFLLLTIIVFVLYKNINAWDRSNMMKIAFMVNLTMAYIVSVSSWVQDNDSNHGKPGCILIGYLLQHFFLSAMFWINAMGFHIWRLFNVGSSRKTRREDQKTLLFYALYAQGVPLLINIITAIIDSTRDKITPHYPNMGELRCFLGENKMKHPNYFKSAKFIYNDIFLFLVQFVNGFFLISIGKVLRRGWKDQAERLKLMGEEKAGFQEKFFKAASNGTIVLRIFVILGVPWVFELISTVISHYHDECQPTSVRVIVFITDLFVCFAGFFIFLTMVVKKEYMKGMRDQATEALSSYGIISPSTRDNDGSLMTSMSELNSAAKP